MASYGVVDSIWEFSLSFGENLWDALLELSPYLLLGFVLSGLVHVLIPKVKIARAFGKPGFASVAKASLFGVPLPLCSCSVIPTAVSLRDQGASRGATLGFLISTPQTGVDSIIVTAGLMDWVFTVFRPLAAFLNGLIAGVLEDSFQRNPEPSSAPKENSCHVCEDEIGAEGRHDHSLAQKIRRASRYAFVDLFDDIMGWILLGVVVSAVIATLAPVGSFAQYKDYEALQFALMLFVGIPLYVCASASTPIAASLVLAGVSPGAALVFLLVGPATNLATVLVVWRKLGARSTYVYLGSIIFVSVGFGILLNGIYRSLNVDPAKDLGMTHHDFPSAISWGSAVVFLLVFVWRLVQKGRRRNHGHPAHE